MKCNSYEKYDGKAMKRSVDTFFGVDCERLTIKYMAIYWGEFLKPFHMNAASLQCEYFAYAHFALDLEILSYLWRNLSYGCILFAFFLVFGPVRFDLFMNAAAAVTAATQNLYRCLPWTCASLALLDQGLNNRNCSSLVIQWCYTVCVCALFSS